jgi:predicted membrane protein
MTEPLFRSQGFTVTKDCLTTNRRSYKLQNIEYVSIHQPLLAIIAILDVGLILFILSFSRYLYTWEIISTITFVFVSLVAAFNIGTLKIHSLALGEEQTPLIGYMKTLRQVKNAVERAMTLRVQSENTVKPETEV